MIDLKNFKVADLVSLMGSMIVDLGHKPECSLKKIPLEAAECDCGLAKLRKDMTSLVEKLGMEKPDGESE